MVSVDIPSNSYSHSKKLSQTRRVEETRHGIDPMPKRREDPWEYSADLTSLAFLLVIARHEYQDR
jgi:hypothetical protein